MRYCSHGIFSEPIREHNMAFTYGGKFEQHINHLYSKENVSKTAKKFKAHEKEHGAYNFGDKFTKTLVPKPENWADESGSTTGHAKWEKNSGDIPASIKKRITEVVSTNLRSAHPLPVVLKVGENVDATHELHVRTFAHNGHMHIGIHILCPNKSLKK
jgi:hypothetical protein